MKVITRPAILSIVPRSAIASPAASANPPVGVRAPSVATVAVVAVIVAVAMATEKPVFTDTKTYYSKNRLTKFEV